MDGFFNLMGLPLELRQQIYSLYFNPADQIVHPEHLKDDNPEVDEDFFPSPSKSLYSGGKYTFDFDLFLVSKQVKAEAEDVFRRENVFVTICTPWPQAGRGFNRVWAHHITHEVNLPLVLAHFEPTTTFTLSTCKVNVSAASGTIQLNPVGAEHKIVILLEDLHLFCRVWYYSALNIQRLNTHLALDITLVDPTNTGKTIHLSLQEKLLLPFGVVKGLAEVRVHGADINVEKRLRDQMAVPYDSPQKCLETSTALMAEGDTALDTGDADAALALYIRAFEAIHILVNGRQRKILADDFFHSVNHSGPGNTQCSSITRLKLRVALVSRTVAAYLHLAKWEEAAYWGIRSTVLIGGTHSQSYVDFFASDPTSQRDIAFLFIRTAIARVKMEKCGISADFAIDEAPLYHDVRISDYSATQLNEDGLSHYGITNITSQGITNGLPDANWKAVQAEYAKFGLEYADFYPEGYGPSMEEQRHGGDGAWLYASDSSDSE